MALKLKLDDAGHAVLKDNNPIYVHDDGKEIVFDANQAFGKIGQLTGEAASYRQRAQEAETRVQAFAGIEDPEAARKALETVKNIDDGKFVAAGKVEELKQAAQRAAEEKVQAGLRSATETIDKLTKRNAEIENQLHEEKIGGGFARSKFIQEKIAVPADMVRAVFGKAFRVEEGKTIAYGSDGKPVYSKTRMGEVADLDEALEILVDQYQYKDQILKPSGATGSGAQQGATVGGKKQISRTQFNAMDPMAQRALGLEQAKGAVVITD